ncbi:MAG: hypothetical protein V4574_09350 [Pseudomonadota bacterium]
MSHPDAPASALRFDAALPDPSASRLRRFAALVRQHATPGRSFAAGAGVYLLLCALSFFAVRPTTLLYFTDYWEHRAILDEVMRGGTRLLDPIYGEAASSRQYTPWSLALGTLARLGHLDADTAMACGAMAVSVLFVIGVHAFARAWVPHRWAPPLLLAALTCAWGLPALIWTGFYDFRSQLHGNYYPASLVFALTFIAWAGVLRLLRSDTPGVADAALLWAVVAGSVITHPLNAAFLVAGAAAFVAFEPGVALPRRAVVMLVIAAGIASTIAWPWFNPLSLAGAGLARGQATFNNFAFFYDPQFVVAQAWPAMFALLGFPALARQRSMRVAAVALGVIFLAYVAGGIADVSVSHRLLPYIVLALHLLLVKAVLDTIDGHSPGLLARLTPRAWRGVAAVAGLLGLCQVAMAAQQLADPWAVTHYPYPVHSVDAETSRAVATLPPGARVLGWDSAALVMPAHGVLVAAFPRPMPLSPSDSARQADYRRFFAPGTPTCERLAIARRRHATHIAWLTIELDDRVQQELRAFGPAAAPAEPWRIVPVPPPGATNC